MTSDVLSEMQSSASLDSTSSDAQQQAPISIHPDALPCLKRQQLENLCIRLGVKSTGKKSELIARLEGFAMGKSASTLSLDSIPRAHDNDDNTNKENQQALSSSEEAEEADASMMLPGVASIRIISKPRESHFVTAAAAAQHRRREDDDAEMGVVLPKSDSRYGSLSGLGVRAPLVSSQNANSFTPTRKESGAMDDVEGRTNKRSFSAASLYPWKKLAAHKQSNSSDSLSTLASNAGLSHTQQAEMGLGLHASDSQASISSTLRRWLKGEGTSAVVAASESQRALAQTASSACIAASTPAETEHTDADSRAKRKRSNDDVASESDASASPEAKQEESSPEIPQRRIKPRPSRAARRPTVANDVISVPADASAEKRVLAEMQARLAAKIAERQSAGASTSTGASAVSTPPLPPSPLKSMSSRTRGRFSSQHEKQFGRMDSIANHYTAVRAREQAASTGSTDGKDEGTSEKDSRAKRARVESDAHTSTATPPVAGHVTYAALSPQRTEEERAAIRRKLDVARHRRRSSTAVGRKSGTTTTGGSARKATATAAAARGPSAKLATAPNGIAQKISFAVRGFMGAARGLTTSSTPAATAASKKPVTTTIAVASMLPPPSPSKERLTQKPSPQSVAPQSSPTKTSAAVTKKRSAFDLQASLARKPMGYTPYSARETVEMLAAPVVKARTTSASNRSLSGSISDNDSQIAFPASTSRADGNGTDNGDKTDESSLSSSSLMLTPAVTPRRLASSTAARGSSSSNGVGGKKTRSSASRAARTSLKTPRKSNAAAAATAAAKLSSPAAAASPRARRRSRQPSLQVAGQTIASQMMSARRQRNNALLAGDDATDDGAATTSQQPADNRTAVVTTPVGSPVAGAAQTEAAGGLGHGSPRKTSAIPLHVRGRGRGKSSVVVQTATASPKSALQRKSSSVAIARA